MKRYESNRRRRHRHQETNESQIQIHVEPVDEIQFDHEEEIKVPVKIELRRVGAEIPRKSHSGSSCYDIKSLDEITLRPGDRHIFDLGFGIKMSKGWMMQIFDRSGLSTVNRIEIPGSPKIIDNDYRGNLFVTLENRHKKYTYTVEKGDKIAQMGIFRSYLIEFQPTRKIDRYETSRGSGCLGSTGR